jgi:hypothetical protein
MLIFNTCHAVALDLNNPAGPPSSACSDHLLPNVSLSAAAERHLVSPGVVCPDHQVCRRFAFARYLYLTGRVRDDGGPQS